MLRYGTPEMYVYVWGDWLTVVGVCEYRDVVLNQAPMDEDDAEYRAYTIPCATTDELVAALNAFAAAGLRVAVGMTFRSEDNAVEARFLSGDGYDGHDRPHCTVEVRESESEARRSIAQAMDILQGALK